MGAIKQFINWAGGGLNYDDDKRLFEAGDSSVRQNVTTNEHGREFVISNMKGTTKKSHAFNHDSAYNGATYPIMKIIETLFIFLSIRISEIIQSYGSITQMIHLIKSVGIIPAWDSTWIIPLLMCI